MGKRCLGFCTSHGQVEASERLVTELAEKDPTFRKVGIGEGFASEGKTTATAKLLSWVIKSCYLTYSKWPLHEML